MRGEEAKGAEKYIKLNKNNLKERALWGLSIRLACSSVYR